MILGGVSKALKQASEVGDQAVIAHEAEDYEKNAEELKKELADELTKLEKPILIFARTRESGASVLCKNFYASNLATTFGTCRSRLCDHCIRQIVVPVAPENCN